MLREGVETRGSEAQNMRQLDGGVRVPMILGTYSHSFASSTMTNSCGSLYQI